MRERSLRMDSRRAFDESSPRLFFWRVVTGLDMNSLPKRTRAESQFTCLLQDASLTRGAVSSIAPALAAAANVTAVDMFGFMDE